MFERDELVLQAATVQHMLAQPIGNRIGFADARCKGIGKMGDHRRVQPIGLGQPPRGAGKLAHLPRVDHPHGSKPVG